MLSLQTIMLLLPSTSSAALFLEKEPEFMAIPAQFQVMPTVAPQHKFPFVDEKGLLTRTAGQFLQQLFNQFVGTNRVLPTNPSTAAANANQYILALLGQQPVYTGYATHDTFSMVAPSNSTGPVTAQVMTKTGGLAIIPIYKQNGAVQCGAGDIVAGLHYMLTFADNLNGGLGGLVLR
jgi:hypothetical protein